MSEPSDILPATPANPLPGAERRVAVRYSCTLKTLCQRTNMARPEDFWWWGRIRDISTTGIGLVINRNFKPGTQLVIEPLAGQEIFEPLQVRVIRGRKQAKGGWLLGCEFADQPGARSEAIAQLLPVLQRYRAADCCDMT